jgi:hypothetical protein
LSGLALIAPKANLLNFETTPPIRAARPKTGMRLGGIGLIAQSTTEHQMATELEIKAKVDTLRSLPPRLEKLNRCLGTVMWPGQGVRVHLPQGMELSEVEKAQSTALLAEITATVSGTNLDPVTCSKARLSLLTKMVMGFPMAANATEQQGSARLDMYLDALEDMPPWAIAAAIKRWGRGESPDVKGSSHNYNFPPSSATLRSLCAFEVEPLKEQAGKLTRLLSAVPAERAMDPQPIKSEVTGSDGQVLTFAMKRACGRVRG